MEDILLEYVKRLKCFFNFWFLFVYTMQTAKQLQKGLDSEKGEKISRTVVKWKEKKPKTLIYVGIEMQ